MAVGSLPKNNISACDLLRKQLGAEHTVVNIEQVTIPEDRLRKFTDKDVPQMMDSIREVGLLCPVALKRRPLSEGMNLYTVIAGARRTRAYQLLLEEAMNKAANPRTDSDVKRFSQMHAFVYPNDTDEDLCREIEIRENLDRKELTVKERVAHTLQLGAITQRRLKTDQRSNSNGCDKDSGGGHAKRMRGGRRFECPVDHDVANSMGVPVTTVRTRVRIASAMVGKQLDLDETPPEELEDAARTILSQPVKKKCGIKKGTPSSGNTYKDGSTSLSSRIIPSKAPAFAAWIKKRHPASFTLDQIRAFRDALTGLVQELEQADTRC